MRQQDEVRQPLQEAQGFLHRQMQQHRDLDLMNHQDRDQDCERNRMCTAASPGHKQEIQA